MDSPTVVPASTAKLCFSKILPIRSLNSISCPDKNQRTCLKSHVLKILRELIRKISICHPTENPDTHKGAFDALLPLGRLVLAYRSRWAILVSGRNNRK